MTAFATARAAAQATTESHGVFIEVLDEPEAGPQGGGELAGVPFAVKDNIDVAGVPTTAGSPLLSDSVPEVDAGVVAALREAGALVIGKTNMHELAFGITSNNAAFGPVRNPVDPSRVAGGSSGGSAAAVALGVVPFSLGTDTGGSVTIPAAFCGVVGFRPTTGRYPGDGVVNLSWTRDSVGIHARTVADVRVVDRVLARQADAPARSGDGLVIGVLRSRFEDLDPEVEEAVGQALARLESSGVSLVEVAVPDDAEIGGGPGLGMVLYEAERLLLARAAAGPGGGRFRGFADLVPEIASPDVRGLCQMMVDQPYPAAGYEEARRARLALRRSYAEMFASSGVDAVLAPAVPVLPPPVGADDVFELNGREVPTFPTVTRHTAPGSVAGVPMLTLPARRPAGALPVGITLEGAFGGDAALLALGALVERILGPH
jgi:mandelamide amidase